MKKTASKNKNHKELKILPVVGIGASAGGLNALRTFFSNIPKNSGLAYVIVMHLSPEHKSILAELLQPQLKIPVKQINKTTALKRNHAYVIPPNANLNSIDTHVRLSDLEEKRSERAPIDHFFRTLAKSHAENSIGIILTGTGSDGTLGIKEIKEKGGLTLAQEPKEAEYDGMPLSAISTGLIDKVLSVKDMPAYLRRFIYTSPRLKFLEPDMESDDEEQKHIQKIFSQVRTRTGRDFRRYKNNTLLRRLQRRMQMHQVENLADYLELLNEQPKEIHKLSDDFLINVTNFFRDPEAFDYLDKAVIPKLFENTTNANQIRIWSVGCATGEEAYSLAILLSEEAAKHNPAPTIQIFASDLHDGSLKKARNGFFPGDIKVDVGADLRNKYFMKEEGGYRVRKELREMVVFTPHNLMSDPPFSRLDMVVCRNLLIYLKKDVQKEISELFHYALKTNGFLFLGTSETLEANTLFSVDSKEFSVYQRKNVSAPEPKLPVFPRSQNQINTINQNRSEKEIPYSEIHLKMVEHYAPPSVLINTDYQILHVSKTAGRYLKIAGGELSNDVFKLVDKKMQPELRTTIHNAKEKEELARSNPLYLTIDGKKRELIISARWIKEENQEQVILVIFEEYEGVSKKEKSTSNKDNSAFHEEQIEELEKEVQETRQNLQAIIEEYETSREEMKASNEELQSANEELRSTMEELETSKEELQSMNEELTTLNQENRHKVEELSRLSNDLQNLMAATDIATLFLDREMRIVRFTPKLGELFNVRPADKGRPISDLTHKLGYDNLAKDARNVIKNLQPFQHEVNDKDGNSYFIRILPYRSAEDRIEGVVITFVDVSALKEAEKNLKKSKAKYKDLFDAIDVGYCIHKVLFNEYNKATDYEIIEINPAFEKQSGLKNASGKKIKDLNPQHDDVWIETYGKVAKTGNSARFIKQVKFLSNKWHEIYAFRIGDPKENLVAVLFTDIDEHKKMQEALKKAKENTEIAAKAKEDFLAHMSHEIRTPLNAIIGFSHMLLEDKTTPLQRKSLETLNIAAENLHSLINDILDFSRLQANKVSLEPEKINLTEFIKSQYDIHKETANKKGIELDYEVDKKIPATIIADRSKLLHVLNNLMSNAIKFTKRGGVKLEVKLEKISGKNVEIQFLVTDTGIGIKQDKLETIFEVFTQADNSTMKEYGGTGLGLTIAKLYLEMMDSQIKVESETGKGSKFWFALTVRAGQEIKNETVIEIATTGKDNLQELNILIVEDDEFSRTMFGQLFLLWGVKHDLAVNGKEAVELVKKNDYDAIYLDIHMPVMDGYEAAKIINKIPAYKGKPVFALTADVTDNVEKQVKNGLFTAKKTKPIDPDVLQKDLLEIAAKIQKNKK